MALQHLLLGNDYLRHQQRGASLALIQKWKPSAATTASDIVALWGLSSPWPASLPQIARHIYAALNSALEACLTRTAGVPYLKNGN